MQTPAPSLRLRLLEPCIGVVSGGTRLVLHGVGFRPAPHSLIVRFRVNLHDPEEQDVLLDNVHVDASDHNAWTSRQPISNIVDVSGRFLLETQMECVLPSFERQTKRAIAARTSLAASSASVKSAPQLVPLTVEVILNGGEQRSNALTFKLHQPLEVRKVSPQSVLMASPAVVVTATLNILKFPVPVLNRTAVRAGQKPLEVLEEMNVLPVFVRVRQASQRTGAISEQTREGKWKLSPLGVYEVEFDAAAMGFGAASIEVTLNRVDFFRCSSDSPPEGYGYRVHRDVLLRALEPACISVTSGQVTEVRLMGDGFVDTGDLVVALLQKELPAQLVNDGEGDGEMVANAAANTKEVQVAQLNATYFSKNEIRCTVPANMPFGCTSFSVSLNGGRQFGQARVVGLLYRDRALLDASPASSSLSGGTPVTIRYAPLTLEDVDAFYQLQRLDPPRRIRVRFQPISYSLADVGGTLAKPVFAEASADTPGVITCRTPHFLENIKALNGLRTSGSSESDGNSVPYMWRFTVSVALGSEFYQGALPFSFYLPPVIRSLTQHHGPSSGDTCVKLRMKHKVPPRLKLLLRFSTLNFAKSMTVDGYTVERVTATQPDENTANLKADATTPEQTVEEDWEYLISCRTPQWSEKSTMNSGEVPHLTIVQVSYDNGVTFFPAIDPPPSTTHPNPLTKDLSYLCFLFYPPPIVRTAIPLSADILGGSYIRLQGENIVDHGAQPSVIFESPTMSRRVTAFVEKGELRCCAPPFNVGLARVFISLNGEQYTMCELHDPETNAPLEFIFYSSPTVTRISPLCVCVRQSSNLRIFGTNLIETDRIKVRVSFPNSQGSGRRLVFKDVPGRARDGVITATTPTFPDEYANQNAQVDVALNGADFSGTSVPLRYFSRYIISRVDPPLGAFEVPVNLTVYVSPVVITDHVRVRIRLSMVNTESEMYDREGTEVDYGPVDAGSWTANAVSFTVPPLSSLLESLPMLTTAIVEFSFDTIQYHGVGNLRDHYHVYNMPQLTSATPLFGAADRETKVIAHGIHMKVGDVVKLTLFLESQLVDKTKQKTKSRRVTARAAPVPVATVIADVNVKRQRLSWTCPSLVQLRASPDRQFPPLVAASPTMLNGVPDRRAQGDTAKGMLLPERVVMQISVVDGQPTPLPFVFRYYRAATLVAMNPRVGYVCSGSLVSFEFAERIATPTVDFRFGESLPMTGRIRDERFVECFSPELSVGSHSINISFNEQHFEPAVLIEGPLANLKENEPVPSSAASFHAFPLPVFVLPPADRDRVYAFGPTSGGTVVIIKGKGFVPDTKIYVRFASQFQDAFDGEAEIIASAKVVDNETIKCVSPPSTRLGRVVLHVSYNLQQFSDSTCFFEYHAPTRYVAKGTLCGPISGQTPLNLLIEDTKGLPSLTQLLQCAVRFESEKRQDTCHVETIDAQFDTETRILSCITPAWPSNELVGLRVSLSRGDADLFEDTRIKFLFYDPPEGVIKIEPSAGPIGGGTEVLAWCGSIVETGEIVVSIQLTKDEPSRRSTTKRTDSNVSTDTDFLAPLPPKTPKLRSTQSMAVQTIVVRGEIVGEAVRFITPCVEGPCTAVLSISLNGINYTSAQNPLHFTYYVEPILRRINPGWAAVEGANDALVIEGEHIRDFGCHLLVRFSLQDDKQPEEHGLVVGAQFVPNSTASATGDGALECVFPAASPGFYELEISLNGQQFSRSLYVSKTFGNLSGTACTALLPFRHFASPFCLATATGPAAGGSTVVLFLGGRLLKILSREAKCQVQFTPIRGAERAVRPSSISNTSGSSPLKASTNISAEVICMIGEIDQVNARVTCRAPLLRVACVSVVDVLLPGGYGASSACQLFGVRQNEREKYYSYESPSITEIAPSCGPTSGGTQLVIGGANILDTAQIFVRFRSNVNEREFVLVPAQYSRTFPGGSLSASPLIICSTPPVEFVDKVNSNGTDSAVQSTAQLPSQAQPSPRIREGAAAGKARTQTYQMLADQSLKVQRASTANGSIDSELTGLGTLRITRTTAKATPRGNTEAWTAEGGATVLVDFTLNAGEQFIAHSVRFHYYQDIEPRHVKWSPRHLPTQCLGSRQAVDSRLLILTLPKAFRLTDSPERVCFRFDSVDSNQLVTKRRRSFVLLHETETRTELVIPDSPRTQRQSTMCRPSTYFKNSVVTPGSENLTPTTPETTATPPVSRRPALDRSTTGIPRSTPATPDTPRAATPGSSPCIAAKVTSANEVTCSVPDFTHPGSVKVFFSPNAQQFVCLGELLFHPAMTIKDEFHHTTFRFCSNVGGSPFDLQCSPSTVLKFLAPEDITTAEKKHLQIQNHGLRKVSEALEEARSRMPTNFSNFKRQGTATIDEDDLDHSDEDLDESNSALNDGNEKADDEAENEDGEPQEGYEMWKKRCFYPTQVVLVPANYKLLKRVTVAASRVDNQSEAGKMTPDDAGCCAFDMSNWGDQVLLSASLPTTCGYSSYSAVIEPLSVHENAALPRRTCLVMAQLPAQSKLNIVALGPSTLPFTVLVTDSNGKQFTDGLVHISEPELHEFTRVCLVSMDLSTITNPKMQYVCLRFNTTDIEALLPSGQQESSIQVLVSDSNGVQVCLCGPPVHSGVWIVARLVDLSKMDPATTSSSRLRVDPIDVLVGEDELPQALVKLTGPTPLSHRSSDANGDNSQSYNVPVTFDFTCADSARSVTTSSRAKLVLSASDNFQTLLALSLSPQIKNGPTVTLECIMPPLPFSGPTTLVLSCGGVVFSNSVTVHCYDPRSWRVLAVSPPCGQLPSVQDSKEPHEPLTLRLKGANFVENRKIVVRVSDKDRYFTAPGKMEQVNLLSLRVAAVKNLRTLLQPLGIGVPVANTGSGGTTTSAQKREDKYLGFIVGGTTGGGSIVALVSSWSTFTFTLRIECGDQRVFASCREVSVFAAISSGSVLSWEEEFELRVAADRRSPLLITAELSEPSLPKPLELAQAWIPLHSLQEGSSEVRRFSARLEEHFKRGNYAGSDAALTNNGTASEVDLLCQLSPLILHPEFITAQIPYPLLQQLSPQTLDVQVSSGDSFYSTPNSFLVYKPPTVIQTTPSVLPRSAGGDVMVTGTGFVNSGRVCVRLFAFKKNRFKNKDEEQQALASINRVKRLQRTDSTNDGFLSYFTRDVEGTFMSAASLKFRMPAYITSYNIYYSVSFDGRSFTEASQASSILLFSISAVTPKGGPISGNTYTTLHGTNIDACLSSRTGLTPLVRVTWKRGARDLEHVMVPGEFYPHEDAVYFYSPQSKFGLFSIAVNVELSLTKQPTAPSSSGSSAIDSLPRFGRDEVSFVMYKTPTIKSVAPLTALVSGLSTTEVIVQGFEDKSVSSMKLAPKLRFKRRGQMQVSDAQLVSEARFECVVPRFNVTNAVATELPSSVLSGLSPISKIRGATSVFSPRRSIGPPKLWTRVSGIFVALLGARNLRASKKNACNPFAVIYVGKTQLKSTRKDGAFNPVWNELFDFEWVPVSDSATLPTARVVLESQLTADQSESLGHVELTFPIKDKVVQPFALRAWFPLRRIRGKYARKENEEVVVPVQQQLKYKKPAPAGASVPTMGEVELAIAFVPPVAQAKKHKKALRSSLISVISTRPQSGKHQAGSNRRENAHIGFTTKKEKLLRAFRQRGAPASLVPTELAVELALNGQDFWSIAPSTCYSILTPIVLDVEPKFICIAGGSVLYISGYNFVNTGCLRMAFAVLSEDGSPQLLRSERTVIVEAKYRSSSSIVCTTPPLFDLAKESSHVIVYVSLNGTDFDSIGLPKQLTKLSESATPVSESDERIEESEEEIATEESQRKSPRKNAEDDGAIALEGEHYVVDSKKVIRFSAAGSNAVNRPERFSPSRLKAASRSENFLLVPQVRVYLTPKIKRVRPTDGVYTSHLTIDGTNFTNTNVAIVRFTSQAVKPEVRTAKLVVVSSTRMECGVPDFPRGVIVRVAVAINGVEFVQCPGELRVFQSPRLTELYPGWVSASTSLELELRGINLTAAMSTTSSEDNNREQKDATNVQVSFSGLRGKKVVRGVCEDGQVRCPIPKEVLQVPTLGGRDKGTPHPAPLTTSPILVDIWLGGKHNAFTGSPLPLHVYREIPSVHLVAPMDGPVYGGFAVVIEGRGFIDTGKIAVRFQLYLEHEATPHSEDDSNTAKLPPGASLSSGRASNSPEKRQNAAMKDSTTKENAATEASPVTTEPAVAYVDVVAKFVSAERVLCPAPSFPQEGVYTVLVALNSVEFSRVSDGSWFLAWQNWQKRKRLLSHALFSRASALDETATASAIAGAAAASASLDEEDIERLRRKSSFMLPKIKSALAPTVGESSSTSFKFKSFSSVSEENTFVDDSEEALSKDPRLLRWHPASSVEARVSGRPLLSLLEYLCGTRETQQFICRRLTVAFKLQSAQFRDAQEPPESTVIPALRFPSFAESLRLIFPNALMRDLEEIWHAAEHRPDGTMTLKQLLRRLLRNADQRSSSPEPGPTHYDPRYRMVSSRETSAIIFPPVVQSERISDPPSALFIDYDAAVQAIKPRPPRPVFRKRKFNTSWCNPVVEGAPDPPPSPRPPSDTARTRSSPRTQLAENNTSTLSAGVSGNASEGVTNFSDSADKSSGSADSGRNNDKPQTQEIGEPPTQPAQGQASKEDAARTPRTLGQATIASGNKRLTSPSSPRVPAKPSPSPLVVSLGPNPTSMIPRQANLSGSNPFYNDIAPLYAKFLNSTEVKRFLKQ